ncbi:hypothetical protein [Wenzhouxiangella marina]|uniref:hypothetical protein n=1 Tax=Wenzhouxiangella marina TaxID=1579979 RepID=UPI0006733308|nr:hypothetical protein [Wenzhouxiangella marina]MBB6087750.1 hypothetical protein [Wenzhouxiangella marina]
MLAGLTGMAGMVSVSNAVNVNPDGLGQVLMFPYYTARGGNDTLISIVNTTERGKAVKIRILEALNSREVLDFNIYMSEWDVWTGAITAASDGGGKLLTSDTTCTAPRIFAPSAGIGTDVNGDGVPDFGEIDFLPFQYTLGNTDFGPQGEERNASGHIEFIEMGTFLPTPASAAAGTEPYVAWSAKHVGPAGAREPNRCATFTELWAPANPGAVWRLGDSNFGFEPVGDDTLATGGLFGAASIINVAEGTMFSYNATAVDAFWSTNPLAGGALHTNPASLLPSLANGTNRTSNVFVNGVVQTNTWPGTVPVAPINATVMFETLMNEYNIEAGLGGRSEWVLTYPTKRFHTDAQGPVGTVVPNSPIPPFTNTWHRTSSGALNLPCEALSFRVWDREETEPTPDIGEVIPSPPPPTDAPQVFELCRETNVVRFTLDGDLPAETEILKEPIREGAFERLSYANFQLPDAFQAGWVRFDLTDVPTGAIIAPGANDPRRTTPADNGDQFEGMPVIGFWVNTFTNGALPGGTLANYGGSFDHHGSRSIVLGSVVIP